MFVAIEFWILYQLGGQFLPYIPRSADEFAGYCMGASAFLALAYTLRANEHIRVTLIVDRLGHKQQQFTVRLAASLAVILSGYLAWHFVKLTYVSWKLNDLSSGLIALPLWIPQAAMALGATVFFIALLESAFDAWTSQCTKLHEDRHEEAISVDGR
ncbi:TRAP transporter small permease [Orrella daihaiensis]|uniref:TRAP transporter small permease protein n=1 Tax=Orrella daihaiensis TaxID=2782176 RepID=A0ABY4AJI8_9BURK|nr:TRAP transporter small permease [Orrella daihaiensis]UOD50118.1 TRAP transporter small permease [Orrella daihaiensis]